MFREMRRIKQQLPNEECIEILEIGTSGVLALLGDDGYPYAVPLSYVYIDGRIIFHGAKSGHKLDAMCENEKASFCVINQDEIVPEKYTTRYRSVIAFGKMRVVQDEKEMMELVDILAKKYRPGFEEEREKEIRIEFPGLCMMELTIEHMTGKEGLELLKERNNG